MKSDSIGIKVPLNTMISINTLEPTNGVSSRNVSGFLEIIIGPSVSHNHPGFKLGKLDGTGISKPSTTNVLGIGSVEFSLAVVGTASKSNSVSLCSDEVDSFKRFSAQENAPSIKTQAIKMATLLFNIMRHLYNFKKLSENARQIRSI